MKFSKPNHNNVVIFRNGDKQTDNNRHTHNNDNNNNNNNTNFLGKKRMMEFKNGNMRNFAKMIDLLKKDEDKDSIIPKKLEFKLSHIIHGENTKIEIEESTETKENNDVFKNDFINDLIGWKKPTQVGPGLNNLGNTCFLNSVLQSLLYASSLRNYITYSEHLKLCKSKGVCFVCEYGKLTSAIST